MKRLLITSLTLSTLFFARAHSKTEIGYRFIEEKEKTYLEVHLTSATIFDLLYELHPELKSRASLKLSSYHADYEAYFNKTLDLTLNNQHQMLVYEESNLIIHDSRIKFLIQGFEDQIESYALTVNGFDFYKNPTFTVFFTTPTITETHRLTKEHSSCSGAIRAVSHQNSAPQLSPLWALFILPLGWISWFLIRKSFDLNTHAS